MSSDQPRMFLIFAKRFERLLPVDGESRLNAAEIYAHIFARVTNLLSGSEGERLLCSDEPPWLAESDLAQARGLASIICSSPETIELCLTYCRAEAAALVAKHRSSVEAVATALLEKRSLTGDQIVAIVSESAARKTLKIEVERRADWLRVIENAARFAPDRIEE